MASAIGANTPISQPFDWRRVTHWFRAARELLTFTTGTTGTTGSTGTTGTTGPPTAGTHSEPPGAVLQLEELMLEHAEAAYRVALSVTRNPHLAEDVTQDAMLKAWQALPTFRGDSPLRNWVLRITRNTAISALRKRRELLHDPAELPEKPTEHSVERQAHGRMALDAFETALHELDELTRSIVVLREVEAMSYADIAQLLEVPLPTVKTRLLRARRQLASSLEGWRA